MYEWYDYCKFMASIFFSILIKKTLWKATGYCGYAGFSSIVSKAFCPTRPFLKLPVTSQEYPSKKTFFDQVPQKKDMQRQFHTKYFSNCEGKIKEKVHFAWLVCLKTSHSCDQSQQCLFPLKYCVTLTMLNSSFPSPLHTNKIQNKSMRHRQC